MKLIYEYKSSMLVQTKDLVEVGKSAGSGHMRKNKRKTNIPGNSP